MGASAQHCTGMTNWPITIQCLGSDDIMSLGIKSSAFLRVEHPFSRQFEVHIFLTCLQTHEYVREKLFQEFGHMFFDRSSASGYVGETFWLRIMSDPF